MHQLVGKCKKEYEKDGVKRSFCTLFFVGDSDDPDVEGSEVCKERLPQGVNYDDLRIGAFYNFRYTIRDTARGKLAFLSGLDLAEV